MPTTQTLTFFVWHINIETQAAKYYTGWREKCARSSFHRVRWHYNMIYDDSWREDEFCVADSIIDTKQPETCHKV